VLALIQNRGERAGPFSTFTWGALLVVLGVAAYFLTPARRAKTAGDVGFEAAD